MNGIAVLIWVGVAKRLFGLGGQEIFQGGVVANVAVAASAVAVCFMLPPVVRTLSAKLASFLPATLVAIVLVTCGVYVFGVDVERVKLNAELDSFADLSHLVSANVPRQWSMDLVLLALPFAGQLAMLAYLDTLLTSLVVDKKAETLFGTKETTAQDRELGVQGLANAVVALFGGIPGAQATIRSVLILNEGARTRIAGVMVGIFVLVEMVLFQDWIGTIPKAVFSGVLIKVGYDVFDWQPLKVYLSELRRGHVPDASEQNGKPMVTHLNIFFIVGTTLVTVLVNLNVAVIAFCTLFYVIRAVRPIHDLVEVTETEGLADED
jgi:SulP family sulfate permease